MNKILKTLFILIILAGMGVGGVFAYNYFVGSFALDPEMAIPKDVSMAFVVDHSNSDQIKNLDKILSKFPVDDPGIKYILEQYNAKAGEEFSSESIKEVFKGDWKVAVGIKMNMIGKKDSDYILPMEMYFAGVFDNADKVEEVIRSKVDEDYNYTEKEGVKSWDNEIKDVYIMRHKNMFVGTNVLENKDAILERIQNKDGLVSDENFKNLAAKAGDENLGYAYIDVATLSSAVPESATGVGLVYMTLGSNGDGFSTKSYSTFTSKDSPIAKMMKGAKVPSIVDKVNATDIIAYAENPGLKFIAEAFYNGFMSARTLGRESMESGAVEETLAEMLKVDKDDIAALMDSQFALSVSAAPKFYPAISFYLQFSEDAQESAQNVFDGIDRYMDEMLKSLQKSVAEDELKAAKMEVYMEEQEKYNVAVQEAINNGTAMPEPPALDLSESTEPLDTPPIEEFFVKKESVDSNGMELKHLYVDWDSFPADKYDDMDKFFREQLAVEDGVKVLRLGLYYGFVEEGVMVVSFEPDLVSSYGKTPLSQDPLFKEAMENLEDEGWVNISYFRPDNMFLIINNYIKFITSNPLLAGTVTKVYNSVEAVLSTFKYFVNGQKLDGDMIVSEGYAKVEKFEKLADEEELEGDDDISADIPEDEAVQPFSQDNDESIDQPVVIDDETNEDNVQDPLLKEENDEPRVKRVK